jgi:hypothetical protein
MKPCKGKLDKRGEFDGIVYNAKGKEVYRLFGSCMDKVRCVLRESSFATGVLVVYASSIGSDRDWGGLWSKVGETGDGRDLGMVGRWVGMWVGGISSRPSLSLSLQSQPRLLVVPGSTSSPSSESPLTC